jgi:hypothetical protein
MHIFTVNDFGGLRSAGFTCIYKYILGFVLCNCVFKSFLCFEFLLIFFY